MAYFKLVYSLSPKSVDNICGSTRDGIRARFCQILCQIKHFSLFRQSGKPVGGGYTERFIYYRKSVPHLLKRMFHVRLSRCSTDLRLYTVHPVKLLLIQPVLL